MTLLQEANELIYGQREADYGSATENFGRIARLWSEVMGQQVTPEQVLLCMVQLKIARLIQSPDHLDSWKDGAGYFGLKGKLLNGE